MKKRKEVGYRRVLQIFVRDHSLSKWESMVNTDGAEVVRE